MKAVDTNILVYAHRRDSPFHEAALTVLTRLANGSERWSIPWPCIHEFIAIVTHPNIYDPPSPLDRALEAVKQWLESPMCEPIGEGPGYFDQLCALVAKTHSVGPMVHDARIAAICRHNGISELWSCDRDFSRYAGLRVVNPLTT